MGDRHNAAFICILGTATVVYTCQVIWFLVAIDWSLVHSSGWVLIAFTLVMIAFYSVIAVQTYRSQFRNEPDVEAGECVLSPAEVTWNERKAERIWKEEAWKEELARRQAGEGGE